MRKHTQVTANVDLLVDDLPTHRCFIIVQISLLPEASFVHSERGKVPGRRSGGTNILVWWFVNKQYCAYAVRQTRNHGEPSSPLHCVDVTAVLSQLLIQVLNWSFMFPTVSAPRGSFRCASEGNSS